MKWQEVRRIYPNQYVKVQVLSYHLEGNIKYIDDVALIRAIETPREATRELLGAKDDILVSHTANKDLKVELRARWGLRVAK